MLSGSLLRSLGGVRTASGDPKAAHDVFHHHHDSNKSDLDRMAERKNEAESIPT